MVRAERPLRTDWPRGEASRPTLCVPTLPAPSGLAGEGSGAPPPCAQRILDAADGLTGDLVDHRVGELLGMSAERHRGRARARVVDAGCPGRCSCASGPGTSTTTCRAPASSVRGTGTTRSAARGESRPPRCLRAAAFVRVRRSGRRSRPAARRQATSASSLPGSSAPTSSRACDPPVVLVIAASEVARSAPPCGVPRVATRPTGRASSGPAVAPAR